MAALRPLLRALASVIPAYLVTAELDAAIIRLAAAVGGFVTAVVWAWMGAGVYALSFGALAAALVGCGLAWWILAQGWRSQWRMHMGEIRSFLKFGGYMVGNNLTRFV